MMLNKPVWVGVAVAAAALGAVGYGVAQTTRGEVRSSTEGMVLVDLSHIAMDLNRRLNLQGQGTGIVWVPAGVAADACGVSVADLAPPAPGHAAVCLAQQSNVSLDTAVQRDISRLVE